MRGGNTSAYGSVLSLIVLFPVAVFIIAIWLWDFTKGFFEAAYHHFAKGDNDYKD
jgi:hypothetical protein